MKKVEKRSPGSREMFHIQNGRVNESMMTDMIIRQGLQARLEKRQ